MIDIDGGDELGVLPDPSKGSIPNPKIPLEEARPYRIRDNSMRMSLEVSSSSEEDRFHERVVRGKQDMARVLVLV